MGSNSLESSKQVQQLMPQLQEALKQGVGQQKTGNLVQQLSPGSDSTMKTATLTPEEVEYYRVATLKDQQNLTGDYAPGGPNNPDGSYVPPAQSQIGMPQHAVGPDGSSTPFNPQWPPAMPQPMQQPNQLQQFQDQMARQQQLAQQAQMAQRPRHGQQLQQMRQAMPGREFGQQMRQQGGAQGRNNTPAEPPIWFTPQPFGTHNPNANGMGSNPLAGLMGGIGGRKDGNNLPEYMGSNPLYDMVNRSYNNISVPTQFAQQPGILNRLSSVSGAPSPGGQPFNPVPDARQYRPMPMPSPGNAPGIISQTQNGEPLSSYQQSLQGIASGTTKGKKKTTSGLDPGIFSTLR